MMNETPGYAVKTLRYLLWTVLFCILIGLFISCRTVRETQTEYVYVNNTDTLTRYKYQRDSIYIHDYIERWMQGDTVYIREHHTEYRDKERNDTVHWVRTVTITNKLYYTKEKEVNRLHWWQTALMWTNLLWLIPFALWLYKKFR